MTNLSQSYVYRVNASDEIVYVNHEWLAFAVDNDAPSLTESAVLGTTLWSHITGGGAIRLYEELLRSIRGQRRELTVPFNCDSPTRLRHMTLTLRSLPSGGVEFEGQLVRSVERPYVALLDRRSQRSSEMVAICSLCRTLSVDDEWVPVDVAVRRRRWFADASLPRLNESVCPSCATATH